MTPKEIAKRIKYLKDFSLDQINESVFKSTSPGIVYLLFENNEAIPAHEAKVKQQWFREYKRGFFISKNDNIFLIRFAVCLGCGLRRASKGMHVEGCSICRNKAGYVKPIPGKATPRNETRSDKAKKVLFEKKSKKITDCKHRITRCLVKYQKKKFIPCYECNDYVTMDIENLFDCADGFNVEGVIDA